MTPEWKAALIARREALMDQVRQIDRALASERHAESEARRAAWKKLLGIKPIHNPPPMALPPGDRE